MSDLVSRALEAGRKDSRRLSFPPIDDPLLPGAQQRLARPDIIARRLDGNPPAEGSLLPCSTCQKTAMHLNRSAVPGPLLAGLMLQMHGIVLLPWQCVMLPRWTVSRFHVIGLQYRRPADCDEHCTHASVNTLDQIFRSLASCMAHLLACCSERSLPPALRAC